jgi:hypothetical protein
MFLKKHNRWRINIVLKLILQLFLTLYKKFFCFKSFNVALESFLPFYYLLCELSETCTLTLILYKCACK